MKIPTLNFPGTLSSAMFSECKTYRYRLMRSWEKQGKRVLFVMLNPSTADEQYNDPTVERCMRRAMVWGCASFEVVNIFALRSTDPRALKASNDPIGPANNRMILLAARDAQLIVCAWGNDGEINDRAVRVFKMLREEGHELHALKLNENKRPHHPAHPLYLSYDLVPHKVEHSDVFGFHWSND